MNNDPYHYGAESRCLIRIYSSGVKLRKYCGFEETEQTPLNFLSLNDWYFFRHDLFHPFEFPKNNSCDFFYSHIIPKGLKGQILIIA